MKSNSAVYSLVRTTERLPIIVRKETFYVLDGKNKEGKTLHRRQGHLGWQNPHTTDILYLSGGLWRAPCWMLSLQTRTPTGRLSPTALIKLIMIEENKFHPQCEMLSSSYFYTPKVLRVPLGFFTFILFICPPVSTWIRAVVESFI